MRVQLRRAALGVLLLACACCAGCTLSDDLMTASGAGLDPAERNEFVAARGQPPILALESDPATLIDLLEVVVAGSVNLEQARAQLAQAEAAVGEARSAMLPNLTVSAGVLVYQRAPGTGDFFSQDQQVFDLTIDLTLPLDVSGRLAESVRAAQARYRSAGHRTEAVLREQRFLVVEAYFNLLQALELLRVNEASIAAQERALRDARARLEAGVLRRNDVLVVEVTLTSTRQRRVEIEGAALIARRAMNVAIGLPVDHPTQVAPYPSLIEQPPDVLPLLGKARYDNPDVDVLVETRKALLHELESVRRAHWPELSIGPSLTYSSQSISEPNANFLGFLHFSWNPDLSGRLAAQASGLEARIIEAAWAVTAVLRRLEERILNSHRRAFERQSALAAARSSVDQARENLRILEEQLRAGVATGREILEAEALLAEQEGTLVTSRHLANLAQFELRYAAGTDPLEFARSVAPE